MADIIEISKGEAKWLIKNTKGKFFTVSFVKRDGTLRTMNARLGVKAYLKGGVLPYDPEEKGLLAVYDMQRHGYRMINLNTLQELKIGTTTYKINLNLTENKTDKKLLLQKIREFMATDD